MQRFAFAFDSRFRPALALAGVTPARAYVELAADRLTARFGPWRVETPLTNIREVHRTGPYRWWRSIGARLSLADRGLTFGSTPAGGVCLLFRDPVPGLDPLGRIRHPGLTVTVAEPDGFAAAVEELIGPRPT